MTDFFAISVDRATTDELNNIHQSVKSEANGWWHHQTNFWIVGGKNTYFWRELVGKHLTSAGANVLVFQLPASDAERSWSFRGANASDKCKWLHENYLSYKKTE